MNDTLTQQILSRLDAIGAKLGVAAQAVWGFYLQQARVEGLISLGTGVLLLIFCTVASVYVRRVWERDLAIGRYEHECDLSGGVLGFFYTLGVVVLLVFGLFGIVDSLTPLLNPGYWAFQQIVSQIR